MRRLLRDIREVRQAKVRAGLEGMNESYLQMDGLGAMEVNEIRFLSYGMDWLRKMSAIVENEGTNDDS